MNRNTLSKPRYLHILMHIFSWPNSDIMRSVVYLYTAWVLLTFKHFCSRTKSERGEKFRLNYMKKTAKTWMSPINDNPWSSAQAKYHRVCSDIHQRRLQRLGPVGESLQSLIIQSQSVPAEYIVFFFEASLPAAAWFLFFVFFPLPGTSHKTHTSKPHTAPPLLRLT